MGRITSGVGVFSGINSKDIIDKLLSLESRPRELAQERIDKNSTQKAALLALSARLLGVQSSVTSFRSSDILNARTASVSDNTVLRVTASASAAVGSTQFKATRQAQSQRLISNGFADTDNTLVGAGTITVKQGGFVSVDTSLDTLNGGSGVPLGKIQITNRAGASTTVDLTGVKTARDVIQAINGVSGIGVTASTSGDRIILTDTTGQTTTAVSVSEVSGGATGAALGLVGGSFSGNSLTGTDVIRLGGTTNLSILNDGNGVQNAIGDDLRITLRDGSTIDVDLFGSANLQNVVDAINNDSQNTGNLFASIAASGDSLQLTDSTGAGGTLSVAALSGSRAAKDLGILGNEQGGGVLTGRRLLAGFNSVLLSNLNGGSGVTTPGSVQLTNRNGVSAAVDFSGAQDLSDVVSLINGAGLGLNATINTAGNGISIADTTGATTSNLIIADNTGTLAADLHIATNAAANSVNSGDLNLRYISDNTRLERLNGGAGIQKGQFKITDSSGAVGFVTLSDTSIKTVGDVIRTINSAGVGVLASVNANGDGIVLTDTAGGGGTLRVDESGGRTAADLRLLGTATVGQINGEFRNTITVGATDTLQDVIDKLGLSGAPLTAAAINDGTSVTPYRLVISSRNSGSAGRLLIDTGATGVSLSSVSQGVDALLQVGAASSGATPLLFSSSNNSFGQVLGGVSVDVLSASDKSITVTISQNNQRLSDSFKTFVTSFNSMADAISSVTDFDTTTLSRGPLFGDALTLQIESTLFRTAQQTFGSGTVRRLADLGITVKGGRLDFNETTFASRVATDPSGVQSFLKTATTGFADKVESQLKNFTQQFSGQIAQQVDLLEQDNNEFKTRIDLLTNRLSSRRLILEAQFRSMESAFATLQSQQTALTQLASLASISQGSSK